MTVRFPPENLTRFPSPLGYRPARSRSTPAFLSSSLYLPIAVRSSSLGAAPGSGSPLIINITRMSCLLRASSVVDALDLIEDARLYCLGAPEPDLVADASPELAKRLKELLRLIAR